MILIDFSGLVFKNIYGIIKSLNLPLENGKYKIDDALVPIQNFILNDIFDVQKQFNDNNVVLCIDNTYKGSWRKNIYKRYKSHRKTSREENPIPFDVIFTRINDLVTALDKYTSYKVIKVEGAEGDDCILSICENVRNEDIIIYSSDKDMLQMQKYSNVRQFSPLLKKYISYKEKHENLNEWLIEHIVLGDDVDEVPKIFNETEFSDEFKEFMTNNNLVFSVEEYLNFSDDELKEINFTGEVFKRVRIGKKTIEKHIKNNTLKDLIQSNDLYLKNFHRNKQLILAEYIPNEIKIECMKQLNAQKQEDQEAFADYLNLHGLGMVQFNMPNYTPVVKLDIW